ncbi:hypothetical protein QUQ42_004118 [Escherichia coli]|nr:hypothetical protein [Escherichia coli]ELP4035946.1 hypothetical protein [Escherichia coli]
MKKYCFLLLVFVTGIVRAENEGLVTRNINLQTIVVDSDTDANEWVTVKTIKVSEENQNNGCGFLCSGLITLDNVTLLGRGVGAIKWLPDGAEKTVNTPDGDMKVRMIYKNIKLRAKFMLMGVNYQRNYDNDFDVSETNNIVTYTSEACDSLYGSECSVSFMSGIVGGEIDVQVKLPPALSNKNYELKNITVGSFENSLTVRYYGTNIQDRSESINTQFVVSGYISVPDRCYLLIDNVQQTDSSTKDITFKDVEADKVTGSNVPLDSKTLQLRSQCMGVKGASKGVQLDAKLTPVDMAVENKYVFKLKPKSTSETDTSRFLGVVARLLSTGSCNDSDNNALKNGVYIHIGQVVIAGSKIHQNGLDSPVPLTFSLCSFGDGGKLLTAGEHTGALKLTARWKFE